MKIIALFVCILAVSGVRSDDGPKCKGPHNEGLEQTVKEFLDLIPTDKISQIYMEAVSNDPEVQKVMDHISSDSFKQLIIFIQNAKEFKDLMQFSCKKLYLDMYYYFNKLNAIFDIPPVTPPPSLKSVNGARPGFHGMILDMLDVIPVDKLKKLYEEKLKTDKYLQLAIQTLKGDEFKSIIHKVKAKTEYKNDVNALRKMGCKVDEVISFLDNYFGW